MMDRPACPPANGKVRNVDEALERGEIREQHFAAPDRAINTVARAVERDAANWAFELVLGHGCNHMCMMMLHLREREIAFACLRACPLAEHVFGMQIARELGGLQVEELLVEIFSFRASCRTRQHAPYRPDVAKRTPLHSA